MNKDKVVVTLSDLDHLIKDGKDLKEYIESKNIIKAKKHMEEMQELLTKVLEVGKEAQRENPYINTPEGIRNSIFSLNNIWNLLLKGGDKALNKVEFELIPFLEDCRYDFYFFTSVYGNKVKEKEHYKNEFVGMVSNHFIDNSIKQRKYKYEVSIVVSAYNHLDYTKKCIEAIMKHMPVGLNYELILINNGSNDRTQEYFETLGADKLIYMRENIINSFINIRGKICEGRYLLDVSNDVIVMDNYLENLLTCMKSDERIAMVVPTTPGVGKRQCITRMDITLEESKVFARTNNISNPARWQEMKDLYNPLALYRSDAILSSQGVGFWDKYFINIAGGDDALSNRLIESGYRLILAKDCFCFHYGKVTRANKHLIDSKKLLKERFEI